jgi:Ca2+-binding EF-hand superfamily protein
MNISGIGGGGFGGLQGLMRANINSNQPRRNAADLEQRLGDLQEKGNAFPKAAQAMEKLGQAEKALGAIDKNFDSIDQDGDGALTKSELKSFADERGLEAPSGKFGRAFSGSGLTRDGLEQLQGKVADAKGRISSLTGLAERMQEKLQNQSGLDANTLQNLSGRSLGISGQSPEESLLESLFAESEEEDKDDSSKVEGSPNREPKEARIRSYGTFGSAEDELLRSNLSSTVA